MDRKKILTLVKLEPGITKLNNKSTITIVASHTVTSLAVQVSAKYCICGFLKLIHTISHFIF